MHRTIREFKQAQPEEFRPIKSFYLKDTLNEKIWDGDEIDDGIREDLLSIAEDYVDYLEVDVEVQDIVLMGSLANYNWSSYSDFDVHIIFDFSEINEDRELVAKYLDAKEKIWKFRHELMVAGYEVELYAQDLDDKGVSSGQFSLLNNEWISKPSREDFEPDEALIKRKSKVIMEQIDEVEHDFEENYSYQELADKANRIMKKLKDNRKKGLDEEGEFSTENLVFKLLRRNGYICRLMELKSKIYDKQFK